MSIRDTIKKSVLDGFDSGNLTTASILVTLGIAVLLGLFIYFIYRTTTKSALYNRGFNKTLALLPVITAGIVLAMQSSLVISLGMVGALSIVRFRNAVKDPMDLTFLFWGISVGIIIGARLFELALIVTLVITAFIFLLDLLPSFRAPCLLVITTDGSADVEQLKNLIHCHSPKAKIRSRNTSHRGNELIYEIHLKDESALIRDLSALEGTISVNVLTHDGDVRF